MRKNKPRETRLKEIIETAVELFLKNGYEGTTMQSIADNSGLSKGGLYHHFASKDDVLLAANDVYFEPALGMMEDALDNPSPKEGIMTFVESYVKYWSMHQRELIFTNLAKSKMIGNIELWHHINDYSEIMIKFFETLFRNGIEAHEFQNHDLKSRALALFATLDGIPPYLVMSKGITPTQVVNNIYVVYFQDIIRQ